MFVPCCELFKVCFLTPGCGWYCCLVSPVPGMWAVLFLFVWCFWAFALFPFELISDVCFFSVVWPVPGLWAGV